MMQCMKRAWDYLIVEPFVWIFYAFFQPGRFQREFEVEDRRFWQRIIPMLRLALPMFLICYPPTMTVRGIFLTLHLIPFTNIVSFLLQPATSIAFGIAVAMVLGIISGIVFDIAFGIVLGILGGIAGSIPVGIAGSIPGGIPGGITVGIIVGITFGIASGILRGIAKNIILGITFGIILGIIEGTIEGIARGLTAGIVVGISFGITFIAGHFRLPFYLFSAPSLLKTYLFSKSNPPQVFTYLQHSALHWDELVYLPLPYLKHTLLIAIDEDVDKALEEINFIAAERPLQIRAARAAALEIAMRDLERCANLEEIVDAYQYLDDVFSEETKLLDPRWVTTFARLRDASQDAARSRSPIGRQRRIDALRDMQINLRKTRPNVAFRDQQMNKRLGLVVEKWLAIAQEEQERLKQVAQEIGQIDNPYKPGQVLRQQDTTFVGRRDLAQQLEQALSKEERRPTFMLTGERRIGKSSTLIQLPRLLGSRYIPIFYDLQNPGVTANVTAFLGTIAREIHAEMTTRGMKVTSLTFDMLRIANKENEASAYHIFDEWLSKVERVLEQEERTLLLTFDEFEKLAEADERGQIEINVLLNWFRSVIQYRKRVALLFSGVRTISEMGTNWAGYFVNVQTLRVSFLQEAEARQLITQPVPEYPSEEIFGVGVVECIIEQTGGHPFLVQAVCSALIDNLNAERREQAEVADVKTAVEQVLGNWWDTYFRDLWERTDEEQRQCLAALKTLGSADVTSIAQTWGVDERVVRRTLQILLKRDLVLRAEDESYHIATPIFAEWVGHNQYL